MNFNSDRLPPRGTSARRAHRDRRSRAGTLSVELAFTAPLLFFVFFASVEFSRFNVIKNSVENAAYEGCRIGILPGATSAKCEAAAEQILQAIGISDATVVVTPSTINAATPQITVDISLNLQASHGFVINQLIVGRELRGSCTLEREVIEGP